MITLYHPHIPRRAFKAVEKVLDSRWIGQGKVTEKWERAFGELFCPGKACVATNSGTSALHLAYIMAGVKGEVITPILTCTATNLPLIRMGVTPVFADIQRETLNINPVDVVTHLRGRTSAIVATHLNGLPADVARLKTIGLPVIEDACHAPGAYPIGLGDFTCFSFAAMKNITTIDGGMLVLSRDLADKARYYRKSAEGYRYQTSDVAAAIGLASLKEWPKTLLKRKDLFDQYDRELMNISGLKQLDHIGHSCWSYVVLVDRRLDLEKKLRLNGIESGQCHWRNDKFPIFGGRVSRPVMNEVEHKYLHLPLHTHLTEKDVAYVCSVIKGGW